ncbi:MAG: hypothetical protein A3G41_01900 [Elusimicrobia bacterium RIFCSPLOWO2_12_FULL_59_9]|nr:MAG: hypothetical protein A3G41_01900 [Elusimicrobia bacterium RIFCSPLOWO2_12_FULL_59_9]
MSLLRSVRFNVYLFCALAAGAALGTFLPQRGLAPQQVERFIAAHPWWGPALDFFGFFHLYSSAWFMGLLGLMAFDIVLCKLKNAPPDPGLVPLPPGEGPESAADVGPEALLERRLRSSFSLPMSQASALAHARAVLEKKRYHIRASTSGAGAALTASKHRLQRWGSYVAHVSLVVILLGALCRGVFGFEEILPIAEGESVSLRRRPWEVMVDKFDMGYYPGTFTPRFFASEVRVFERGRSFATGGPSAASSVRGRKIAESKILVNAPLSLGRMGLVRLYQASWGATGMFRSVTVETAAGELTLSPNQALRLAQGSVSADLFYPDFAVAEGNRAANGSVELLNPAVRFRWLRADGAVSRFWLFDHWPRICFFEDEGGSLHEAEPPFRLKAVDPVLFSGLQAAYDPGYYVVVAGSLGLLAGLSALFYLHRRKLWILMRPDPGGGGAVSVVVGGWSSRATDFRREFDEVVAAVRAG